MQVALALTTYGSEESADDFASRLPPDLIPYAPVLHRAGHWSRGRIIYPQLGGLSPESASVMVVVEQTIGGATSGTEVRTLNVEVRRAGGRWQFERLISAGGEPVVPAEPLPAVALAVLAHPSIELPDSARWDIAAGLVSERLLDLLLRLADRTTIGVVALSAGHSWEIYGTPRQSDHSRGLAVDIYRLGDRLVIDDRAKGSATHSLVTWLYGQPEVARMGSPWALDGFGGRSFTDPLHQDHLHIAIGPEKERLPE
ncbi:MAG TPA: hypothetical protein VGN80_10090 [Devosiaceae bacterium]|jgi:hypothetical protein|nr:hypothetical protein [Devosiaceae bacterium]